MIEVISVILGFVGRAIEHLANSPFTYLVLSIYAIVRLNSIYACSQVALRQLDKICDQLEHLNSQPLFAEAALRKWQQDMAEREHERKRADRETAHRAQIDELLKQNQEAPK